MTLWVRWKKASKVSYCVIPEDAGGALYIGDNTGDNWIKVKMPFDDNSLTTNFFEGSNAEELRQSMFAHINMQAEDPRISWERFYAGSNHAPAHLFSWVIGNTR